MVQYGWQFWTTIAIFLGVYVLIALEIFHRTTIAIAGASIILLLHILEQKEAFHVESLGVDWNVIFLLISMMIIVNITKKTGLFEYLAVWSVRIARGNPLLLMIYINSITAFISAFLDNVTTVLLVTPVTITICQQMQLPIIVFLITNVLASNIGGTATLIGDPPNIMIASKARLTFMDFIYHLTPVIILCMIAYAFYLKLRFGKMLKVNEEARKALLSIEPSTYIKDRKLLKKCLFVLGVVLMGFGFHGALKLEPATIALAGAALLLLLSGIEDPAVNLEEVEWTTIFFFIGLFIIIGATVKVGLISLISGWVLNITQGNFLLMSLVIMWFSAFASSVIDNIPYVATMNELIVDMAQKLYHTHDFIGAVQHPEIMPVWWSLALGACLGGNGTLVGASANVVVAGISSKLGYRITFMEFTKVGMPVMILTVLICTFYVLIRYFWLKF